MNYTTPKNLLSTNNAKTIKGNIKGFTTYIMYLAPFTQNSKGINLCSHASEGCVNACLFGSGAARFEAVQNGKINKTEYFLADREKFLTQLVNELTRIEKLHDAIIGDELIGANDKVIRYKKFAVRLNGTSDISFEKFKIKDGKNIFELFPNIQFYDYTKNHLRFDRITHLSNYHLTFSRSETNEAKALEIANKGYNVAAVFLKELPTTYKGIEVVNGDETDLTFLQPKGTILGLKFKKLTGKGAGLKNKEAVESDFIIK
jgi:hypothetical protein